MLRRLSSKKEKKEDNGHKKLLAKFMDFLNSSIWSIPISSFIEQKSIVFDRQQMETDVYVEIHKEYTNLIDTLIECFCEDVGSSGQKLVEALNTLDRTNLGVKQRVSFRKREENSGLKA
ncbi:unnamed protein product [Caenorhabditis auriculariae]|uniref:Cilia- and flagella-associated protein 36 n=1 Tax=Caenorhabditis auriculariae TaxID=2777116 RepID=A0A8S1H3U5_9PELO|nr:unnamed protein product [Caenorhabditis auriculariae]